MRLTARANLVRRRLLNADTALLALWFIGLTALEALEGRFQSDVGDAVGVAGIYLLLLATYVVHSVLRVRWVRAIQRGVMGFLRSLTRFWIEMGVDLRGSPPLPLGFPPQFIVCGGVLIVSGALLWLTQSWLPSGIREFVSSISFAGYILLLGVIWTVVVGVSLVMFGFPLALLHDKTMVNGTVGMDRKRLAQWRWVLVGLVSFGAAMYLLPPWTPLAIYGILGGAMLLALGWPGGPGLSILWRSTGRQGACRVFRFDWRAMVGAETLAIVLSIVAVVMLTRGELLFSGEIIASDVMPVTTTLGFVFSWCGAAALMGWTFVLLRFLVLARFRNPGRNVPLQLRVAGFASEEAQGVICQEAGSRGWKWSPGSADQSTEVEIELGDSYQAAPFEDVWPLKISAQDLERLEITRKIERRDEIQRRRAIFRGLERLFRQVASRKYHGGEGFWLGLQHWFVLGLTRDARDEGTIVEDDEENMVATAWVDDVIGTPFHSLFPLAARSHFFRVMSSLELDLIFVEDGVGFRRLRSVLRSAFEHFDIHGGRRRAEEKNFTGIPGVRVMIHEYILNEPLRSQRYPEPDYDDVGRARILHVFKDRGGEESPIEAPPEFRVEPLGVGV